MSDIKFDGEWVIVEGNWTKLRTMDLMLDAPSRRSSATGYRRALVHDYGDKLTLNYNRDYPGGVNILGSVSIEALTGNQIVMKSADLVLDSAARRKVATGQRRALVHDFNDGLTINWGTDYPGGVTLNGNVVMPNKLTVAGKDVAALLTSMQAEINQLKLKVAALEA